MTGRNGTAHDVGLCQHYHNVSAFA